MFARRSKSGQDGQNGKSRRNLWQLLAVGLILLNLIIVASGFLVTRAAAKGIKVPLVSWFLPVERETMDNQKQLALEPFIVNLADPEARRYLRISISLGYTDPAVEKEMGEAGYRVRDAIIKLLRSKTLADLAYDKEEVLRQELLSAVNGVLGAGKVTAIYFEELVTQ